jgi:hypothetical protein
MRKSFWTFQEPKLCLLYVLNLRDHRSCIDQCQVNLAAIRSRAVRANPILRSFKRPFLLVHW